MCRDFNWEFKLRVYVHVINTMSMRTKTQTKHWKIFTKVNFSAMIDEHGYNRSSSEMWTLDATQGWFMCIVAICKWWSIFTSNAQILFIADWRNSPSQSLSRSKCFSCLLIIMFWLSNLKERDMVTWDPLLIILQKSVWPSLSAALAVEVSSLFIK